MSSITEKSKRMVGKALSVNRDMGEMEVVMTTKSVDRDGDIVEPLGMDVTNFQKNPVVLWAHDRKSVPIAKIEDLSVNSEMMVGKVKFDLSDPFAKLIFQKYADGFMNAWSIGFSAKEDGVTPIRDDKDRITGFHFRNTELSELSAVPVPANPQALTRSFEGITDDEAKYKLAKGIMSHVDEIDDAEAKKFVKAIVKEAEKEPAVTVARYEDGNFSVMERTEVDGFMKHELTEKQLTENALKVSLTNRGAQGKIETKYTIAEKFSMEFEIDVLQQDGELIKEAKVNSIVVLLPNPTESKASDPEKDTDRSDEGGAEPESTLAESDVAGETAIEAQETDTSCADLEVEMALMNARIADL